MASTKSKLPRGNVQQDDGISASGVDDFFAKLGSVRNKAAPPPRPARQISRPAYDEEDEDEPTISIGRLCAFTLMLFGLGMLAWGGYQSWKSSRRTSAPIAASPVSSGGRRSVRIDEVELGYRLAGKNPLREQVELIDPDPATWRRMTLHMRKETGNSLWIQLLRPLEWIEKVGAEEGGTIFLDLPEMGAVGDAEVTMIGRCPTIMPGDGNVVTGTFKHEADERSGVVRLRLEGQAEATGVTANHPYWSEDRQEYVAVGELKSGELVNTESGPRRVESITPDPSFCGFLYNLETTEHVYRVGTLGTLVHNSCVLQPYEIGGGHHIFSKKAFEGVKGYDLKKALSIPKSEIDRLGLNHLDVDGITQTQRRLFTELAESGRANTLAEHARIARESLVAGGLSEKEAASLVRKAQNQLKRWGITGPSGIPWN